MELANYLHLLRRIDYLVRTKATGCPNSFAQRLSISVASLYRYLNTMKNLGAPIAYSKERESYIYEHDFELKL